MKNENRNGSIRVSWQNLSTSTCLQTYSTWIESECILFGTGTYSLGSRSYHTGNTEHLDPYDNLGMPFQSKAFSYPNPILGSLDWFTDEMRTCSVLYFGITRSNPFKNKRKYLQNKKKKRSTSTEMWCCIPVTKPSKTGLIFTWSHASSICLWFVSHFSSPAAKKW